MSRQKAYNRSNELEFYLECDSACMTKLIPIENKCEPSPSKYQFPRQMFVHKCNAIQCHACHLEI